jgi:hypothetical protein
MQSKLCRIRSLGLGCCRFRAGWLEFDAEHADWAGLGEGRSVDSGKGDGRDDDDVSVKVKFV